jgi:hypothetical protein
MLIEFELQLCLLFKDHMSNVCYNVSYLKIVLPFAITVNLPSVFLFRVRQNLILMLEHFARLSFLKAKFGKGKFSC